MADLAYVGPAGSSPRAQLWGGGAELNSETGPYPFSIAKANALLSSHGWTVVPGGTTTCTDPAKCGPGSPKGAWPLTRRPALVRECAA